MIKSPFRLRQAGEDLTSDMMPKTRRAVFFDVVKLHWKEFVFYGLLVLLFAFPMIFITVFEDIRTIVLIQNYTNLSAEEQLAVQAELSILSNIRSLLFIPCFMILGVALSGFARVIRQFAWEENVYFKTDFGSGIKQNIKQTLLFAVILGVLNYIAKCMSGLVLPSSVDLSSVMMLLPYAVLWLMVIPVFAYAFVASSIYSNKFSGNIKIGTVLISNSPFRTLAAYLAALVPFIPCLIPNMICHLIGSVVASIATPFVLLGAFLHTYELLDKHINKEHYPELVGRGTFKDADG